MLRLRFAFRLRIGDLAGGFWMILLRCDLGNAAFLFSNILAFLKRAFFEKALSTHIVLYEGDDS